MGTKKTRSVKGLLLACFGIHLATWLVGCGPAGGGATSVTVQKVQPTAPANLTSVSPSTGPITGGTALTINGANFFGAVSVSIGGVAATGVAVNGTGSQLTCTTPANTEGTKDIRVTSSISGSAALIAAFTYTDAPIINSITPGSAPQDANTALTINGSKFEGVVTVTVGGVAATSLVVNGTTQITCVVPASTTAGAKDVVVTSSTKGSVTLPGAFTHNGRMTITGVSPNIATLSGGLNVTIAGTNLKDVTSVTFGTTAATITQQTGTGVAVQVTAPAALATGAVDITVVSSSHGQVVAAGAFTYTLQFTASGRITYEDIPVVSAAPPLQLSAPVVKPARLVDVEVVRTDRNPLEVLGSGKTDLNGNYTVTFAKPGAGTPVRVRALSRMTSLTTPTMDFNVVDNTIGGVEYALLHPTSQTIVDTNPTLNFGTLLADDATRINGPFSILDIILKGVQAIRAGAPSTDFPQLFIAWSVNNSPATIGTSFYTRLNDVTPVLFLLGDRQIDSDEFDKGVVMHEFGHYMEDQFGRTDSPGGQHGSGDFLDIRVAFGEGFGNAVSSMLRDDPLYIDTFDVDGTNAGVLDLEDNESTLPQTGYYSEGSVGALLYDLYDSNADTCASCTGRTDNAALGLGPIFATLGDTATISKVTSLHEFIRLLKNRVPGSVAAINEVAEMEGIATTAGATTPTNNPAELAEPDVSFSATACIGGAATGFPHSPVYRNVNATVSFTDHVLSQACSTGGPSPLNRLFGTALYLVTAGAGSLDIVTSNATGNVSLTLFQEGQELATGAFSPNGERISFTTTAGVYVLEARCVDDTNDVTYNIGFTVP